jgi:hypothetical protein
VIHVDKQGIGMGEVSLKFVWQDIGTFSAVQETFYGIISQQFDISTRHVVGLFENMFHTAVMQLILNEMNKYAQQEI